MKMCAGNLKIVQRCSSAVFWFECVYVRDFDEDSEDLFIFYNIIDRENKKEHFCSSGSSDESEDIEHQTKNTTEGVSTWSSEVFRIFSSRDVKCKSCKTET